MNASERAEKIGISLREYMRLANGDPRIVADPALATEHAVAKLRAWLDAGRPVANPELVVFRGDDDVRRVVVATLADLPLPARWWVITNVLVVAIGRGRNTGWFARVPLMPHVINLDVGRIGDDLIAELACHEIGHAIHASAEPAPMPTEPPMPARESNARILAVLTDQYKSVELAADAAARLWFRGEQLANEWAALVGHPCAGFCGDRERIQHRRDELLAARDHAAEIAAEVGGFNARKAG